MNELLLLFLILLCGNDLLISATVWWIGSHKLGDCQLDFYPLDLKICHKFGYAINYIWPYLAIFGYSWLRPLIYWKCRQPISMLSFIWYWTISSYVHFHLIRKQCSCIRLGLSLREPLKSLCWIWTKWREWYIRNLTHKLTEIKRLFHTNHLCLNKWATEVTFKHINLFQKQRTTT